MKPSRLSRLKIAQLFCWAQEVWTELNRLFRDPPPPTGVKWQKIRRWPKAWTENQGSTHNHKKPGHLVYIPGQWQREAGRGGSQPSGWGPGSAACECLTQGRHRFSCLSALLSSGLSLFPSLIRLNAYCSTSTWPSCGRLIFGMSLSEPHTLLGKPGPLLALLCQWMTDSARI